jgi:hypothetical protein
LPARWAAALELRPRPRGLWPRTARKIPA